MTTPGFFRNRFFVVIGGIIVALILLVGLFLLFSGKVLKQIPATAQVTYTQEGFVPAKLSVLWNNQPLVIQFSNQTSQTVTIKSTNSAFPKSSIRAKPKAIQKLTFDTPGEYEYYHEGNQDQKGFIEIIELSQ